VRKAIPSDDELELVALDFLRQRFLRTDERMAELLATLESQVDAAPAQERLSLRNAADQTGNLVKVTPHRVVREMYEQFIAYARAFIEKIAQYQPNDNHLAAVVDGLQPARATLIRIIAHRRRPTCPRPEPASRAWDA